MDRQKNKYFWLLTNSKGFTLIEMAIVLIIIGIIIGAVVKGKDLIRSAEQKKIYTKYANAWSLCYLNFYDRTGKRLGDTWDLNTPAAGQDGKADTASCTNTACANLDDGHRDDLCDGCSDAYGLLQVGLTCPTTNTTKAWKYKYMDSCGGAHDLSIAFCWDDTGKYNYMLIKFIPNEMAIALDTMIDGEADGTAGDFLHGNGTAWDTTPCTDATWNARWKMQF
jgi:prepilin-type N-terminal cleavage/methylation domain-containing protein